MQKPSMLYYAEKITKDLGGAKIYIKREDLNHTGSHKINNVLGQALLAKKMGKKRLIAETGAGQHGVATATVAALFGMEKSQGGRRRYGASSIKRISYEFTWRKSNGRKKRYPYFERCRKRSHARLDRKH